MLAAMKIPLIVLIIDLAAQAAQAISKWIEETG